jgi:oxalate decarboxylase/phosphoglucose isomerase-like protein (cupin superfamily)
MSISDCHQIELPKIHDPRGNLTFVESERHVPFEIKRVYYLYDVPGGATRAGHAHRTLQQVLIAIAGSFEVLLDDGKDKIKYQLNRSYCGLYISPLIWRVIDNFSSGAVCLSIVSDYYNESDYFREYDEFLRAVGEQEK